MNFFHFRAFLLKFIKTCSQRLEGGGRGGGAWEHSAFCLKPLLLYFVLTSISNADFAMHYFVKISVFICTVFDIYSQGSNTNITTDTSNNKKDKSKTFYVLNETM